MLTAKEIEKKIYGSIKVNKEDFVSAGLLLLAVNEHVVKAFCFGFNEGCKDVSVYQYEQGHRMQTDIRIQSLL